MHTLTTPSGIRVLVDENGIPIAAHCPHSADRPSRRVRRAIRTALLIGAWICFTLDLLGAIAASGRSLGLALMALALLVPI